MYKIFKFMGIKSLTIKFAKKGLDSLNRKAVILDRDRNILSKELNKGDVRLNDIKHGVRVINNVDPLKVFTITDHGYGTFNLLQSTGYGEKNNFEFAIPKEKLQRLLNEHNYRILK